MTYRHVPSIIAILAYSLGAGCSSLSPTQLQAEMPTIRSAAFVKTSHSGSWMVPNTNGALLYVTGGMPSSSNGVVVVFSYPTGSIVGTLTGFNVPLGECVDAAGDVFITNAGSNSIVEYAHGGTSPIQTLSDPGQPSGCSIDPQTGDLAVTNMSGNVAIYTGAHGTPALYTDGSISEFLFCAYDGNGNLFADGTTSNLLAELPKGQSSFTNITFNNQIAGPSSMQWSGGGLVVVDAGGNWRGPTLIDRVQITGSTGKVVGTTRLKSHHGAVAAYGQYWIEKGKITGPARSPGDGHNFLGFWRYPRGGKAQKILRHVNYGRLWGTVVSVGT
jgi:hypothetical protein